MLSVTVVPAHAIPVVPLITGPLEVFTMLNAVGLAEPVTLGKVLTILTLYPEPVAAFAGNVPGTDVTFAPVALPIDVGFEKLPLASLNWIVKVDDDVNVLVLVNDTVTLLPEQ